MDVKSIIRDDSLTKLFLLLDLKAGERGRECKLSVI